MTAMLVACGGATDIRGRAVYVGQTQHSGITVALEGTSFQATTAEDGSYLVSGVPRGVYTLIASAPDYQPDVIERVPFLGAEASAPLLELRKGRRIAPGFSHYLGTTPDGSQVLYSDEADWVFAADTGSGASRPVDLSYGAWKELVPLSIRFTPDSRFAHLEKQDYDFETGRWAHTVLWVNLEDNTSGRTSQAGYKAGVAGNVWLFCAPTRGSDDEFISISIPDGVHRRLATCPNQGGRWSLSPDGKYLAFYDPIRGVLSVAPTDGGSTVFLGNVTNPQPGSRWLGWTPDSRLLVYAGNFGFTAEIRAASPPDFVPQRRLEWGMYFDWITDDSSAVMRNASDAWLEAIRTDGNGTARLVPIDRLCNPGFHSPTRRVYFRDCLTGAVSFVSLDGGPPTVAVPQVDAWEPGWVATDGAVVFLRDRFLYLQSIGEAAIALSPRLSSRSEWRTWVSKSGRHAVFEEAGITFSVRLTERPPPAPIPIDSMVGNPSTRDVIVGLAPRC